MKFLQEYKIFENIQQADNYIYRNNLDPTYYEQLKEIVKSKGKVGLTYVLTLILYNSNNKEKELKKITEYLDKVINSNIKIDTNTLVNSPEQFYNQVDKQLYVTDVNKFVDEYAPGFLKKDLKRNYLDQISKLNFKSIDKDSLRGKMSLFKTAEEWLKYVKRLAKNKDNLEKLRIDDDVTILYENDDWLIYKPDSFESINYINYPQWCTIYPRTYQSYIDRGYYFIVIHNKLNKKLSYIVQVFPEKDDLAYKDVPDDMTGYFTMHKYKGTAIYLSWEPEVGYLGFDPINDTKTGILKVFFDKFVRNGKVVL